MPFPLSGRAACEGFPSAPAGPFRPGTGGAETAGRRFDAEWEALPQRGPSPGGGSIGTALPAEMFSMSCSGPLSILYEDEDYLIVDKPPGMPIHPSPGHDRDSLLNRVAYYYGKTGQTPAFRPLYRLDRDTSGLVAVGKHRLAVSSAQQEKTYLAVCEGFLSGCGTVDVPSGWRWGARSSDAAAQKVPNPR